MTMLAFLAFAIATVFAIVIATGGKLTDDPQAWMIAFFIAGFMLDHLPYGPTWPRRGPQ